jgi:hypothetical protein
MTERGHPGEEGEDEGLPLSSMRGGYIDLKGG